MRLRGGTLQTSMPVFLAKITVVSLKLFLRRMFPSLRQCLVVFFYFFKSGTGTSRRTSLSLFVALASFLPRKKLNLLSTAERPELKIL